MLTLDQWKTIRRVDHTSVAGFNMRTTKQQQGVDLKVFDAEVAQFNTATNDWDRVAILGSLLQRTEAFVSPNIDQRYRAAVRSLKDAVCDELTRICGVGHAFERNLDIIRAGRGGVTNIKRLRLNVHYLTAAAQNGVNATIDNHIDVANQSPGFRAAKINVERVNNVLTTINPAGCLLTGNAVPERLRGAFQEGGNNGTNLIIWCNAQNYGANTVDVFYVDRFEGDDVLGFTFQPGKDYRGETPNRPIIAVTLNPPNDLDPGRAAGTLGHELGHALTGCGEHSADVNNLMCGGFARVNNRVSHAQIGWLRNSRFIG